MLRYGFPNQGFFSLQIPEEKRQQTEENLARIEIVSGSASVLKIDQELKHLIDEKWDWNVIQISEKEYLATFPNKTMLTTLSKSGGVEMSLHRIFAKVTKTGSEASASSVLQTGWVKLYNIHPRARYEEAVRLIAKLAGEVVVVDELSLIREGPVRVKLNGRNINKLRGFVEIFIGKVGHEVRFVAEEAMGSDQPRDPPPKKPEEESEDEEDDSHRASDQHWDKRRRGNKTNQQNQTDKGQTSSNQGLQHKKTGLQEEEIRDDVHQIGMGSERDEVKCKEIISIQTTEPLVEVAVSQEMLGDGFSSQEAEEEPIQETIQVIQPTEEMRSQPRDSDEQKAGKGESEVGGDKILVHVADGVLWMNKEKWPVLHLPETLSSSLGKQPKYTSTNTSETEQIAVDEENEEWEVISSGRGAGSATVEVLGRYGEQLSEESGGWKEAQSGKRRTVKQGFYPAVATRKSKQGEREESNEPNKLLLLAAMATTPGKVRSSKAGRMDATSEKLGGEIPGATEEVTA
ncbi:unnamed protein product [Urochloa decumbens]|uniref:DUF4283 domain-containing protein n=1 Tax=Urochloa decumbens TaxID=240449 RepID=A0ABC9GRM6_9POAL